ncbi:hypothetical protein [Neobacillus sp. LXY-4]|uniref:hypothetical protein n=1 Tax=Neobacillus sp. LXY-4 TaxID=3379826 RepID=UPI003EDF00A0
MMNKESEYIQEFKKRLLELKPIVIGESEIQEKPLQQNEQSSIDLQTKKSN